MVSLYPLRPFPGHQPKNKLRIYPTACGALSSVAPPRSPRRASWNPRGTLVESSWNLTSGPPWKTPEPTWAETPKSFQLLGNNEKPKKLRRGLRSSTSPRASCPRGWRRWARAPSSSRAAGGRRCWCSERAPSSGGDSGGAGGTEKRTKKILDGHEDRGEEERKRKRALCEESLLKREPLLGSTLCRRLVLHGSSCEVFHRSMLNKFQGLQCAAACPHLAYKKQKQFLRKAAHHALRCLPLARAPQGCLSRACAMSGCGRGNPSRPTR